MGWMGREVMKGGKEREVYGPFPTSSAVTPRHDNKLNENRLDSDLSTYNMLGLVGIINLYPGFITLCITEMAMH